MQEKRINPPAGEAGGASSPGGGALLPLAHPLHAHVLPAHTHAHAHAHAHPHAHAHAALQAAALQPLALLARPPRD